MIPDRDWEKEIEEAADLMRSVRFHEIAEGHSKAALLLVDLVRELRRPKWAAPDPAVWSHVSPLAKGQ
jgi:hypothetical protein